MKQFIFGIAFAAMTSFAAPTELVLAENGKTAYTIVYDFGNKDVLLDPVVTDLADILKEITGSEFPVKPRTDGPGIYIGVTPPGEKSDFAARERRIKSVGRDLYIYGDHRHGTYLHFYLWSLHLLPWV